MKDPGNKSATALPRTEWDFSDVPDEELIGCCYWEYARESVFLRKLRERCWAHWKPHYAKGTHVDAPRDEALDADLRKAQGIGYPAEVFLRGISCPPDGVLSDAPPLKKGEVHSVTGSFPNPWQKLTKAEREYRAKIDSDVTRIPLVPFERGHAVDAKDIREWIEVRRKERDAANERVRREFPKACEETLLREARLHFPTIQPSIYWSGGKEVTIVHINWGAFTDDEIATYFRKWLKANRPSHIAAPNEQGKKLRDWRVALERLGTMRALHVCSFADHRFPAKLRDRGEKHCYQARRLAAKKFRELFPFLPDEEMPVSWTTLGQRSS